MTLGNAGSPKYCGRRWIVRIGAKLLVTLLVVSTVGWLYFLRPDDTQLDIALTYVVRLLADTLTKSDPRILNQELSLLSPCDPPIASNDDAAVWGNCVSIALRKAAKKGRALLPLTCSGPSDHLVKLTHCPRPPPLRKWVLAVAAVAQRFAKAPLHSSSAMRICTII
jgi:hypothetical protein